MSTTPLPLQLGPPPFQTKAMDEEGFFVTYWQSWFNNVHKSFIGGIGGANLPGEINVVPNVTNTFTPFLGAGFVQQINPTAAFTIEAPSVILPGEVFIIAITQDATGGRTATWNSFYHVAGLSLNTSKSTTTYLMFQINAAGTHADIMFWGGATGVNLVYSTQAALATLAGTLTAANAGLLVCVTDYAHILEWTGTAWEWGPGESGSGYFADFAVAPTAAGWHACDGSTVAYLKSDGTTANATLPNTVGTAAYRESAAAYASAITAKVVPTISGHTESGTANITDTALANVAVTGAASAATHNTEVDSGHTHNLTAANAPIALPGDPVPNYQAITWFRQ